MKVLLLLILLASPIIAQDRPIEEGWLGIKVFQTTRSEVEKILGVPSVKINAVDTSYRHKDGTFHFAFSHAPCSNEGRGRFNVPKDTVLEYRIFLKEPIELPKFKWDKDSYERYEDTHLLGVTHYDDLKAGVSFTTERGTGIEKIGKIIFRRTSEAVSKLLCEGYK